MSALLWAAQKGRVDVVKLLVDANANLDLVNEDGNSALHFAVLLGSVRHFYIEMVTVLVDAKANLDLVNEVGWSALHYAAAKGSVKMVTILVAAKANLDLVNKVSASGVTAVCLLEKSLTCFMAPLLFKRIDCVSG
mmetsp:Transcript_9268/g.18636  ORF Transcript_9268/g.18636 Transcript_9268/m.18636 type:complete len:136 (-) Transcript_9268:428-835(-)